MARPQQELQHIAKQAGHSQPLIIALDQENGGVNSLFDEDYVCQFPSQMGVAATGRSELAYEVAKATATQLSACGINLVLGPVLDVLSNARDQPLGVRSVSDDPQEVSQYCVQAVNGIRDAGVACAGKHFPTYGSLDFPGSGLEMPVITQTLEQLSLSALVPFRDTIASGSLDGVFVGGVRMSNPSMQGQHACLSDQVVDDLLRSELGFKGVAISECLEMEALSHELGVQNGVVMAVEAGCDVVLLCRSYAVQLEAIKGMKLGIENGILTKERLFTSLKRVLRLKSKCTSWAKALNPPGISLLSKLHPKYLTLSQHTYDASITVVRDKENLLPLSASLRQDEELLLLTPLIKPLPASALTRSILDKKKQHAAITTNHDKWHHPDRGTAILSGEEVFRELGRSLARARHGKLLHTSYTANGVRPVHENLINRASTVIIVTADANRNLYQAGFAKHVAMICSMLRSRGQKKHIIAVAVSSPYDFALDKSIGTYICSFDYTENAMRALVRVLCGDTPPRGTLPGTMRRSRKSVKSKQFWLVEEYSRSRDAESLDALIRNVSLATSPSYPYLAASSASSFELGNPNMIEGHFVVRNSSTGALYGFAATYRLGTLGILGAIFVDPAKRNISIGKSLHRRAMRSLMQSGTVKMVQLGSVFPAIFLGIPVADDEGSTNSARDWFAHSGWDVQFPRRLTNLEIPSLNSWSAPEGLLQSIQRANMSFDLIHGLENADTVLAHVAAHANPEVVELYREALAKSCGVVRAKGAGDGLLGTVVICREGSPLARYIPPLAPRHGGVVVGGILAPVVPPSVQAVLTLQGLALMGVRQIKSYKKATTVVLSWTLEDMLEPLRAMGFETLQAFEEITNSPENWADLA
ncbi:related to beta-N-acetylglucosaminidase [Cephalotrichum gorgonifer]|uniref:Related to beta-N-acetylglucosaminidase n=1 Tax=Cephalotrichum gorgonifer TaxID=2041049 RepID=A0AAE8N3I2_9PEZI|nr:related to beta-N-acetylglucosaminidase [Cephalotrichum gorgonifer]